jgi:hypothetical protein
LSFGFGGSNEDSTIKKPLTDGDDLEEINKITEICSLLSKAQNLERSELISLFLYILAKNGLLRLLIQWISSI